MTYISRILVVAVCLTTFLSGCNGQGEKGPVQKMSEDQLIREIDGKYENPKAHYELGKRYLAEGLTDKAQWEFNIALQFDPTYRDAQAGLVKTLRLAGRQEQARTVAEGFIEQAKKSAQLSLVLGQVFQAQGGLDDFALACFQQALSLSPNNPQVHRELGFYYLGRKDRVRAEEFLRRSFQLDPYQADVAGQLGKMGIVIEVQKKDRPGDTGKPQKPVNQK